MARTKWTLSFHQNETGSGHDVAEKFLMWR